jgi:hypothetical protein
MEDPEWTCLRAALIALFSDGCTDVKIKPIPHSDFESSMTRAMEQVGAGLEKIVASSLRRAPAGQGPLLAWAMACGHAVAARTRALDFSQGILRVEVPDWGWRSELQALVPQYLAVINRYAAESVKWVEFVVPEKAAREDARATQNVRA